MNPKKVGHENRVLKLHGRKRCAGCLDILPLAKFPKRGGRCKPCRSAYVKARYATDIDVSRAKNRAYDTRYKESRKRKQSRRNESGEASAATRKWIKANPKKRQAHRLVEYHKAKGTLVPQACERCGVSESVQAHHDDYDKPLDVRWLCGPCHKQEHRAA